MYNLMFVYVAYATFMTLHRIYPDSRFSSCTYSLSFPIGLTKFPVCKFIHKYHASEAVVLRSFG